MNYVRTLLIHFDVDSEHILLETFISSARGAQAAVTAFNNAYFNGAIEFELIVIPPESGSFKQNIGIVLKGIGYSYIGLWSVIQLMDSETVQRISKELTGKIPADHLIEAVVEPDATSEIIEDIDFISAELEQEEINNIEELISESVRGALQKTREEISNLDIPTELKYELENAQSDLFGAALADPDVKGIGFGEEDDFPIRRNQFAQRAIRPVPPKREEDSDPDWRVEVVQIRVTSPQFERLDQTSRRWKGKNAQGSNILFEVEDEEFWQRLNRREFEFADSTVVEAQIATLFVDGKAKLHRAIRILKVDSIQVGNPLDDNAIAAIVGRFKKNPQKKDGPDLFRFL